MTYSKNKIRLLLYSLILFLSFDACKEPENLGPDVLPPINTSLNSSDTFSLVTYLVREDSIQTKNNSLNLLGNIKDPVFGNSTASFCAQVLLSAPNVSFGSNPLLDSIVLALAYSGYYGDTLSAHEIKIFELNEGITNDVYYSNHKFSTGTLLGNILTSDIKPGDSIILNGASAAPQLRLRLNDDFGNRLLTASSGIFADNNSFINFFKGICITDTVTGGNGSIVYFNPASGATKLSLYYRNDTGNSLVYDFTLKGEGRVNSFTHDYSNAAFGNNFPVPSASMVYVQSLAGVKTKIEMPYMNSLTGNKAISVNKAELIIKADAITGDYPPHEKLLLAGIDSAGKSYFLPDYIDSQSNFGGNLLNGTYNFVITRYVQQVLSGVRENNGLYILPLGAAVNANRTVAGGPAHSSQPMKLHITFTNLNP